MQVELVDKEDAYGTIDGSHYGRSVRVVARSPLYVLFTGVGAQIWNRKDRGSFQDKVKICWERPTKDKFIAAKDEIEKAFGEGALEHVLTAWSKHKTALFEGGGEALALPNHIVGARHMARYAAESVSTRVDLTGRIACCKQCGAQLTPHTNHHRMGFDIKPDHPRSLEDCQRITNHPVIAVHSYDSRHPEKWGYVEWFETWDGETLQDPDFCDNKCAAKYGRRAASELPLLEPGIEPAARVHVIREDVRHHEEKDPEFVKMADGRFVRI
jgi:hypothetical protein